MTQTEKANSVKEGERLKREIKGLTAKLDKKGRLQLKLALMGAGASETVARRIMNGDYQASPRQDLIDTIEEVLVSFKRVRAS